MKLNLYLASSVFCSSLALSACQTAPKLAIDNIVTAPMPILMVSLDSDGDGVPDDIDECPGTPANVMIDEKGCPPSLLFDENFLKMEVRVYYNKNSSEISSQYYEALDQANNQLQKHLDSVMFIEGHIAKREDNLNNQRLASNRAESVKNYLILKYQIDSSRIKTYDCGGDRPLALDDTIEGSEFNQRVYTLITNSEYDIGRLTRNEVGDEPKCQLF